MLILPIKSYEPEEICLILERWGKQFFGSMVGLVMGKEIELNVQMEEEDEKSGL